MYLFCERNTKFNAKIQWMNLMGDWNGIVDTLKDTLIWLNVKTKK